MGQLHSADVEAFAKKQDLGRGEAKIDFLLSSGVSVSAQLGPANHGTAQWRSLRDGRSELWLLSAGNILSHHFWKAKFLIVESGRQSRA